MFDKKGFSNKKLKEVQIKKKKDFSFFKNNIKWLVAGFFVLVILYFWNSISLAVGNYTKKVLWSVVKIVAQTSGKEAKKDALGNVNILLLGIGGKNHDGGYLTDSMMIASFNPKLKTLTFLSVPRDLYVKYPWGGGGRINYIFAREYLKTRSFDKAADVLKDKMKEITGVEINYYVLVDFGGFEKLVDNLGGITVDVPETLVDHRYPGPNWSYITFKITKGIHTLDGATALKYARSRHSTSDFSRSARQEQIIKALIDKVTSSGTLTSPSKMKALYLQFKETVKTDFDFNTLLGFVPYAKGIKIHSYVLNSDCYMKKTYRYNLTPGCFVYPATRADFNGQAVLLPKGATSVNVDNYEEIQKFAFIALGYPELWLENSKIQILNGIEKRKIRRYYRYLKPIASKLAFKLRNYGFNIVDVKNSPTYFDKTTGYIYKQKPVTQDLIKSFVPAVEYKTGDVQYAGSGFDMTLVLGEDYLKE